MPDTPPPPPPPPPAPRTPASPPPGQPPAGRGRPANADGIFQTRYREVTISAVVFGLIFGAIMNAAITYAGLKIGFTIVGSAIAAVLGFGVLRGILRKGTILETNIGQTVASAVNTTNAGVIFTVPVLLILAYKGQAGLGDFQLRFDTAEFWLITLACMAGAILGCVFIVPLRKQMLDIDRLRFPSSTAVAAILKSPGAGPAKSVVLLIGIVVAALIYLPVGLPQLGGPGYSNLDLRMSAEVDPQLAARAAAGETLPSTLTIRVDRDRDGTPDLVMTNDMLDVGRIFRLPDDFQLVFAIAPFAIGAGYLTGRAGLMVLAGGILAYLVLNPLAYRMDWLPATVQAHQVGGYALGVFNRPLGIGLLLGGALMGVLVALPAIREAIRSIASAKRTKGGVTTSSDELSLLPLILIGAAGMLLLLLAAEILGMRTAVNPEDIPAGARGWLADLPGWLSRGILVLVAAAWIWFAGIVIAQCTGMTDWSPISGMALLTVVLVMLLAGTHDVLMAVLLGAALCVAISCAADMMGDLKTGYLVGAQPKRQQVLEIATAAIGPVITMSTLVLIVQANMQQFQIPIGPGTDTVAPQAQALEAVITGVQGGEMPYALYGLGALLGVLLGLGAFPGLGVLVGLSMYLPIFYILTYGLGCIINIIVGRIKGRTWAEEWGVPFCAGLIVGEAMLALIINAIVLIPK
jgi:uncharacterized oligopeptide transporter (OPT) family protein